MGPAARLAPSPGDAEEGGMTPLLPRALAMCQGGANLPSDVSVFYSISNGEEAGRGSERGRETRGHLHLKQSPV